ncbi:MAG: ABC transporter substrate-binding protein [archaeon]|nr:ABC transporter substrate-binding protein [archaeon]
MNSKLLAIVAVIVVVIAGLGVYAVVNHDDEEKVVETDRLLIYGNVNNDDVIDDKDLTLLKQMIDGDKEPSALADVNADGTLDDKDVEKLQDIIDKKAKTVFYYNAMYKKPYETPYPLKNIVVASPQPTMSVMLLGPEDKAAGTAEPADTALFAGIKADELWEVNKAYQWNVGVTKVSNLPAEKKADAVITTIETYAMNTEKDFEDAKIPVIRLDVRGTSSISAALMIGFLCGAEEKAEKFVGYIDKVQKEIDSKTSKVAEDKKVSAMIVSKSDVYGNESGFTSCIKLAGANLAVEVPETSRAIGDKEWLNNVAPDYVLAYTTVTKYAYDTASAITYWEQFTGIYDFFDSVPDNFMFVGYYLPDTLRAAYLAEVFYPDQFEKGYGDKIHQEYVDSFLSALHDAKYDVTKDGNFLITKEDYQALKA